MAAGLAGTLLVRLPTDRLVMANSDKLRLQAGEPAVFMLVAMAGAFIFTVGGLYRPARAAMGRSRVILFLIGQALLLAAARPAAMPLVDMAKISERFHYYYFRPEPIGASLTSGFGLFCELLVAGLAVSAVACRRRRGG